MGRFLTPTQPIPDHSFDFDEAYDNRVADESGNVVDAETFHQLGAMCFNSLDTNFQHLRDLFCGPAFSDQAQHFALARTQRREEISFRRALAVFEQSLSRGLG